MVNFVGLELTTNRENVYSGKLMVWKAKPYSQHLGSLMARSTLPQVNRSSCVQSLSADRRAYMAARSVSFKKPAVSG